MLEDKSLGKYYIVLLWAAADEMTPITSLFQLHDNFLDLFILMGNVLCREHIVDASPWAEY